MGASRTDGLLVNLSQWSARNGEGPQRHSTSAARAETANWRNEDSRLLHEIILPQTMRSTIKPVVVQRDVRG